MLRVTAELGNGRHLENIVLVTVGHVMPSQFQFPQRELHSGCRLQVEYQRAVNDEQLIILGVGYHLGR